MYELKRVQRRISDLLSRIISPDFLFSPVKGRSYIDNASMHRNSSDKALFDIKNYFPSCTINKAIWFFKTVLHCSEDVTWLMAKLVTEKDALPIGSPCSPILAYFIYSDMWKEISDIVSINNRILTVYADDITISGISVSGTLRFKIEQIIHKHGHLVSQRKKAIVRNNKPVRITGVYLSNGQLSPPNVKQKKLHKLRDDLIKSNSPKKRKLFAAQIRGHESQFNQIRRHNSNLEIF